jgi:hypothetical protein
MVEVGVRGGGYVCNRFFKIMVAPYVTSQNLACKQMLRRWVVLLGLHRQGLRFRTKQRKLYLRFTTLIELK